MFYRRAFAAGAFDAGFRDLRRDRARAQSGHGSRRVEEAGDAEASEYVCRSLHLMREWGRLDPMVLRCQTLIALKRQIKPMPHPYFAETAEFCETFDQNSFDPDYPTLPLEAFEPIVLRF